MSLRARAVIAAAFAVAVSACVPIPMRAGQVAGGVSMASIDSEYSAIGEQGSGGVAMAAAGEFAETWWLEAFMSLGDGLETGTTENIYYPPDRAKYVLMSLGVRKDFPLSPDRRWTPWLHAGLGLTDVSWNTYYYAVAGFGLALAGGIDRRLGSWPLAVRAQLLRHAFSGEDTYGYGGYDTTVWVGAALLVWTFGDEAPADH